MSKSFTSQALYTPTRGSSLKQYCTLQDFDIPKSDILTNTLLLFLLQNQQYMRLTIVLLSAATMWMATMSCNSGASGNTTFCDTTCMKDSIKYSKDDHPLHPFVYISSKDCNADTLIWSHDDLGVNRKLGFTALIGKSVRLNKDFIKVSFKDTSYADILFNDCEFGRGFQVRLPFTKSGGGSVRTSGLNPFDKKFVIADGLLAYTDRGNIFVEELETGKKAQMTFGERIEIDYDYIHETVDSVIVTPTHIRARVKLKDEWKVIEKDITLK